LRDRETPHFQRVLRPRPVESTSKAGPGGEPAPEGRPQQLPCNDRARAGPEPGSGPRARPDVEEAVDGCPVTGLCGERAPQEVLVERERAAVGVSPFEVRVG